MASIDTHSQPTLDDLRLLTEASQLLTSLDLETVMRQVIDLTSSAVGAAKASLFLHSDNQIDWEHIFLMRDLKPDESIMVLQTVLDEGLAGWVMRNRSAALVSDTETDTRWHVFPDDPHQPRSVLCVPFIYDDRVLAVLTLAHPETDHFNEHHRKLVQIIANQAAVAIRNAQLFQQTQAQQRQLEVILHALPEILFVLDSQGRILLISDGVPELLSGESAMEREDIIGQLLSEFAGESQPGRLLAPAQRIIQCSQPQDEPWTFETRDDEHGRDYQVTMGRWQGGGQQTHGYTLLLHDVTTLRDLHRFKDEMLKIVSHDLRNPLSLIISARDMLELDLPPVDAESEVPHYLEIIRQSTIRMETLLDDLMRTGTTNQRQIDPEQLVRKVTERVRPLAERKQQVLEVSIDLENILGLVADPMLIGEAMENYLSNAIKYTPKKGRIIVRTYSQENRFYFIVEDNGIGIAAEYLPQLFEPYFRPPDTVEHGYGIGLNLVKTIVERHRGRVWVESTKHVGSEFGFWLPLSL
ncbi:MAG: GAF domain-containing protein [Anaerolineae bacterium]|nr:GAF domain-containing protein [Anaerolineae bacterium]